MIARLQGRVVEKLEQTIILDVHGVGYELFVSANDLELIPQNEECVLYTYFSVRENAQELFGFTTLAAKRLFELLKSVSGVGPKVALSILNLGEPEAISSAIYAGDTAFITAANGVGKKVAEKVVVELKDKVASNGSTYTTQTGQVESSDDAQQALIALGYQPSQAAQALAAVDRSLSVEQRIRQALKELS